jgi:hypothetical protein
MRSFEIGEVSLVFAGYNGTGKSYSCSQLIKHYDTKTYWGCCYIYPRKLYPDIRQR